MPPEWGVPGSLPRKDARARLHRRVRGVLGRLPERGCPGAVRTRGGAGWEECGLSGAGGSAGGSAARVLPR